MILLKSFWNIPIVEEKKAVRLPIVIITTETEEIVSKNGDSLMIRKTPAVTMVAACISADTGVGPSIASGSQICNPIWADFPITPTNSSKPQKLSTLFSCIVTVYGKIEL